MAQFERYIGIDYSGAETSDSSCRSIRVHMVESFGEQTQVQVHKNKSMLIAHENCP